MRGPVLVLALICTALAAPLAGANDAPEPRPFETRILVDGTASGDYGNGQVEGVLLYDGGHDILTVDAREGYSPSLEAGLFLRLIAQVPPDQDAGTDLQDTLRFTLGSTQHELSFLTNDGSTFTGDGFDWVGEPTVLGDGHMFAVDGFVSYATLGLDGNGGGKLTDLTATGMQGGEERDVAPGTYHLAGQDAPAAPGDGDVGTSIDHDLEGPQPWLTARSDISAITGTILAAPLEGALTIDNNMADTEQTVEVTVSAPDGITVTLGSTALSLAADGSETIPVTIEASELAAQGHVRLHTRSVIGGYSVATIPIVAGNTGGDDTQIVGPDMETGDTFQQTFTTVGTFEYHCHPHPWMQAAVTIEPADANQTAQVHTVRIVEPDTADGDTWLFEPAQLTVHSGDTVVWINDGQQIHTVHGIIGGAHDDHDHDHGDHDHGESEEESPMPSPAWFLLIAAIFILLRGRRA